MPSPLPKSNHQIVLERDLRSALRSYGYDYVGNRLIELAVRGFTSERIIGQFRDIRDACEYMIPRIADEAFRLRVQPPKEHKCTNSSAIRSIASAGNGATGIPD